MSSAWESLKVFLQKTGTAKILGSQVTAADRAFTVIGVLDKVAEGGLIGIILGIGI